MEHILFQFFFMLHMPLNNKRNLNNLFMLKKDEICVVGQEDRERERGGSIRKASRTGGQNGRSVMSKGLMGLQCTVLLGSFSCQCSNIGAAVSCLQGRNNK